MCAFKEFFIFSIQDVKSVDAFEAMKKRKAEDDGPWQP
jgi:hypothetical protein